MVRSFAVNLNKSEGAAERAARRRSRNDWMILGLLTVLLAVVSYLNVRQMQALSEVEKFRDDRIKEVTQRLDELQREGMQVSRDDVENLYRVDQDRVMWTRKLMAIADVLPRDMAVTGIFYHNRQLRMNTISQIKKEEKEFDKAAMLIDQLRNSEMFFSDFKKIQFVESRRVTVDEQDILSIAVVASLEPDPASMNKVGRKAAGGAAQGGKAAAAITGVPGKKG